MLSCREASRLQSDRLDRPLPVRKALGLHLHLFMCRACNQAERQLGFLRKAMSEFGKRPHR